MSELSEMPFRDGNVFAFKPQDIPLLLAKMAKASGISIAKTGKNTEQNYMYTEETEVIDVLSRAANEHGLLVVFIPNIEKVEYVEIGRTSKGSPVFESRVLQKIRVYDVDTAAYYQAEFPGAARDWGDKGIYKAMTGAKKYATMETFAISTGADPERNQGSDPDEQPRPPQQRGNRQQPPARREQQRPGRSTEKGSITEGQLKNIEALLTSVTDFDSLAKSKIVQKVLTDCGAAGLTRADLSEEQAAKFQNLLQQEFRNQRKARDEAAVQKAQEEPA